jgi:flagellar biosynthesis/type III secretory pathway protein FliH
MSVGAVRLTTVVGTGDSVRSVGSDDESARAKAMELLRGEIAQERARQQSRCRKCETQLDECMRGMRSEIEVQVVEMGLKLAEIILRHQLPDREMLEKLIRETLDPMSDLRGVRIRVSPSEATGLKDSSKAASLCPSLSEQVEIVADGTLLNGDMLIESRNGIFNARLKERLSLLNEKLTERMKHSNANHDAKSP